MNKYQFSFRGRQSGAIGIFYKISDTYQCSSLSEAKSLLYEDYEHIGAIRVHENGKLISMHEFNAAPFIKVRSHWERERAPKTGTYRYTKSDAPENYKYE